MPDRPVEVLRLRADVDYVTGCNTTITTPCRAEENRSPLIEVVDDGPDLHPIDRPRDTMLRPLPPTVIRIDWNGYENATPSIGGHYPL